MQPPRHLDPSMMKPPPPHKPYMDNYMSHNAPDMQKDASSLGSFSNFPLSTLADNKCNILNQYISPDWGVDIWLDLPLFCTLYVFKYGETEFLVSFLFSGLNSNMNVPLDMGVGGGSGGGAVCYKEPPQSRMKKLWSTDPLEQDSKSGTEKTLCFVIESAIRVILMGGWSIYERGS